MTLEELYRQSYGRILASLIRTCRDFTLAEDALQDAFTAAHVQWPARGWPPNPVAWLLTTARHKAIDQIRRRTFLEKHATEMISLTNLDQDAPAPQDSLRLIFTCCHPALALDAQVALTLRTLGGLTTEQIARAFLLPVPTLAQRLVRAQAKIKLAGIPYEVPDEQQLAPRLEAVLAVIYLIFNEGYTTTSGPELVREDLCAEAIRLGREVVALMPDAREPKGLLALMLLNDARRATRTDAEGSLVLLEDQDRGRWDRSRISEGTALVERTLRAGPAGPYTLQAAIAAVHAEGPSVAATDWEQIIGVYHVLYRLQPTPVVALNRAVAIAMKHGPAEGLAQMAGVELPGYSLLPAARADLLRRLGRFGEAAAEYRAAIQLVSNSTERRFLERRLAEVTASDRGVGP